MQIFAQQISRNLLEPSLIATPMMPIIILDCLTKIIMIPCAMERSKDAIRSITRSRLAVKSCTQAAIYGADYDNGFWPGSRSVWTIGPVADCSVSKAVDRRECRDRVPRPQRAFIPRGDANGFFPVLTRFIARRRLLIRLRVPLGSIGCGTDVSGIADRRRFKE